MAPLISDYAMLSNCRITALVSREGSIDWLCLPEPQSPGFFAALLDDERGGRWTLSPEDVQSSERRYRPQTCVLETTYRCASGRVRITDALQMGAPAPRAQLAPDHELTRRIECLEGAVRIGAAFAPRPRFDLLNPHLHECGSLGIAIDAGSQSCILRSDLPLQVNAKARSATAVETLRAGEQRWMALGFTADGPQIAPMIHRPAEQRLDETSAWWREWLRQCQPPEVARDYVIRSALTLKALTFGPTGAVLAAPTTSLPEEIGGERNWDYRFCWIRDASFTMRAMLNLGMREEARAFLAWLMYASRSTGAQLEVLYDIHGRTGRHESTLDRFSGYMNSQPVRIGNAARHQLQLDTFGALLDAAWLFYQTEGTLDRAQMRMLRHIVTTARDKWREPDRGIWEIRSGAQHHTLSKAMCWVAMDRGLRFVKDGAMRLDGDRLQREMDEARTVVMRDGYNESLGAYTGTLNGDRLDASLLLLSVYGFEPADSSRMHSTMDRIFAELGDGSAALHRYIHTEDGISGKEGRFGICGFWGVEALARAGRVDEAIERFDSLMSQSNDVGLFAEEIDVHDGRALGNFPQALTHVGVINAAWAIAAAKSGSHQPSGEAALT